VAHGVKCHVSCDMARYGDAGAIGFFNKKKPFCSDCEQKPGIRVDCVRFVSGTVVAPIES